MRKSYSRQRRFDCSSVAEVQLNLDCRDEIVPILTALQCVYTDRHLRRKITKLVADDLNRHTRRDIGRTGFDDWQVVVLAAVRLGCGLDYDKLQDLAENHRALRGILGVGEWDGQTSFLWKRLRNTICLLRPETLQQVNQLIVEYGQRLHGEARQAVRADSFVIETDIHYPTESSLIGDGVRKIVPLCVALARELGVGGWRQHRHLQKRIKQAVRLISQISASKSPHVKARLPAAYEELLERTQQILERAKSLAIQGKVRMSASEAFVETLVANGVDTTFGIVGSAYMDAHDLFPLAGIRFISVAHEQNAAHMADGYARVTGRHGVCIAQNGPGITNFVTAIAPPTGRTPR